MGAQQTALMALLAAAGYLAVARRVTRPHLASLRGGDRQEILRLYREFGGVLDAPELRPGAWDCVLAGGLIVEFDDEQHFNRYRRKTLETSWAQHLPWRDRYVRHCAQYEGVCLLERGWGGYWTSVATQKQFGPAGPPRMLDGAGSPRWKHRALCDAIQDITALRSGLGLARLAVYDSVGGVPLSDVLDGKAECDPEALRALVSARTVRVRLR